MKSSIVVDFGKIMRIYLVGEDLNSEFEAKIVMKFLGECSKSSTYVYYSFIFKSII